MSSFLAMGVSLAGLLLMQYGGWDLAVAEKWQAAKMVRYRAEGVHNGREMVVLGDYEGKADVFDRLTLEFTWDARKRKIVGPVTMTDGKTELKNIKSDGTNCGPPELKGEYEHFQSVSYSMSLPDQIQIKGTRTYPPARVSNYPGSCSLRSIPGGKEEALLWVSGAGPEGLGMPIAPGGPVVIAPDRKSFSIKTAGNWTWTFTPTLLQ